MVNFQTAEIAKIKAQSAEKCILNNLLSVTHGIERFGPVTIWEYVFNSKTPL